MSWKNAISQGILDGLRGRVNPYTAPGSGDGKDSSKIVGNDFVNGDVNIIDIIAFKGEVQAPLMGRVTEFHIYESIVSPVVYGHLEIADAINMQEDFIIDEQTYVKIVFETPGSTLRAPIDYLFRVNKVFNKRDVPSLAMKTYGVQLVSAEAIACKDREVSNFKLNDTAGPLIKRMIKEHIKGTPEISQLISKNVKRDLSESIDGGRTVVGKNKLQVKVLPTNRKPFEAIHQLALVNNISPEGHSLYTFYEDRFGYNFKPIEKLMKDGKALLRNDQSDAIFFFDHMRNENKEAVKYRNILAYNIISSGDNATVGVNTVVRVYNQETGEYTTEVTGSDQIDKVTAELTSTKALKAFGVERETLVNSTEHDHLSETLAKRELLIKRISQYEAQILIYGDTNLTVGKVIECQFPRSMDQGASSDTSKDSGYYLITHLRHMVLNTDRPQHVISCNLMRAESARS